MTNTDSLGWNDEVSYYLGDSRYPEYCKLDSQSNFDSATLGSVYWPVTMTMTDEHWSSYGTTPQLSASYNNGDNNSGGDDVGGPAFIFTSYTTSFNKSIPGNRTEFVPRVELQNDPQANVGM